MDDFTRSQPGNLELRGEVTCIHRMEGWVGPKASVVTVENRNILQGIEPGLYRVLIMTNLFLIVELP
jgi:hypothetical protein